MVRVYLEFSYWRLSKESKDGLIRVICEITRLYIRIEMVSYTSLYAGTQISQ